MKSTSGLRVLLDLWLNERCATPKHDAPSIPRFLCEECWPKGREEFYEALGVYWEQS